jgi:hypothetical protein
MAPPRLFKTRKLVRERFPVGGGPDGTRRPPRSAAEQYLAKICLRNKVVTIKRDKGTRPRAGTRYCPACCSWWGR